VKDQHFCELEDDLEDLQECTVDLSALAEAAVKPLERELEDLQNHCVQIDFVLVTDPYYWQPVDFINPCGWWLAWFELFG